MESPHRQTAPASFRFSWHVPLISLLTCRVRASVMYVTFRRLEADRGGLGFGRASSVLQGDEKAKHTTSTVISSFQGFRCRLRLFTFMSSLRYCWAWPVRKQMQAGSAAVVASCTTSSSSLSHQHHLWPGLKSLRQPTTCRVSSYLALPPAR